MARILIIDDDRIVRDSLVRLLTRSGHDLAAAADGRAGVAALADFDADLVLTDINMPEMDGIEVIDALRTERPDLPVVAISGGGRLDKSLLLDNALALGAVDFLAKPFEVEQLLAVVDQALREQAG